jgi:pimeloyl-ACP methyl ester carboxylesterase
MGGLVALAATLDTPGLFDGLVLLSPLIDNGQDNAFNRVLAKVASKVCPSCSPSPSWMDYMGVKVADITASKVTVHKRRPASMATTKNSCPYLAPKNPHNVFRGNKKTCLKYRVTEKRDRQKLCQTAL